MVSSVHTLYHVTLTVTMRTVLSSPVEQIMELEHRSRSVKAELVTLSPVLGGTETGALTASIQSLWEVAVQSSQGLVCARAPLHV